MDEMIPDQLTVRASRVPGELLLRLQGELALGTAEMLLERIAAEEPTAAGERIVVDLTELEFMDSTGLHALVRAQGFAQERDANLFLRPGPRVVQRLFELTGLGSSFAFEP